MLLARGLRRDRAEGSISTERMLKTCTSAVTAPACAETLAGSGDWRQHSTHVEPTAVWDAAGMRVSPLHYPITLPHLHYPNAVHPPSLPAQIPTCRRSGGALLCRLLGRSYPSRSQSHSPGAAAVS